MIKSLLLACTIFIAGCAVRGEPIQHKTATETLNINTELNGGSMTATIFINNQPVITHNYPPFVNSRDEKTIKYHEHNIRSVLKIIKGLGSTNAQVYVYVDNSEAITFFF